MECTTRSPEYVHFTNGTFDLVVESHERLLAFSVQQWDTQIEESQQTVCTILWRRCLPMFSPTQNVNLIFSLSKLEDCISWCSSSALNSRPSLKLCPQACPIGIEGHEDFRSQEFLQRPATSEPSTVHEIKRARIDAFSTVYIRPEGAAEGCVLVPVIHTVRIPTPD